MGCNCGDNEYNIEIENNGSYEPTTPIYNITLANVGVDGFSPLVEFVDVTSASFRIQTTDKNGINVSEPIPLSDYIEDNFAKLSSTNTFTANNTFDGLVFFNNTVYTDRLYSRTPTPLIIGGNSSTITLGANTTTVNYHGYEIVNTNSLATTLADYSTSTEIANTYLEKDGSNATSNIAINGIIFRNQSNHNNIIKAKDGLNLELSNGGSILDNTRATIDLQINGNTQISGDNNVNLLAVNDIHLNTTNGKVYYGATTAADKEVATIGDIPDTSSFVTINTTQTITGSKTFSNNISIQANSGGAGSILGVGENYAVGLIGFTTSGTIQVGSSASNLYLNGALDRPSYNGADLALRSDIPSLTGYATEQWVGQQGYLTNSDLADYVTNSTLTTTLANYQPLLVSGTNIKTINNQSLLGSGNIDIQGGGGSYTAGTGINIANNVISVDNTIVTTNTAQTISGRKLFNNLAFSGANGIADDNNKIVLQTFQDSNSDWCWKIGDTTGSSTGNFSKVYIGRAGATYENIDSGNIDDYVHGGSVTNPISFSATSGTRTGTITFGIDETNTYPILKYEYNLGSVTIPVNLLTDTANGDGLSAFSSTREGILRRTFSVDSTVERTTNKVTALSADLTDTQYPSAKLFFDTVTALTQVIFQLDSRITALENNINGGNA